MARKKRKGLDTSTLADGSVPEGSAIAEGIEAGISMNKAFQESRKKEVDKESDDFKKNKKKKKNINEV